MYSRTQVRSASASCGVNSGVTARDLAIDRNEYTAPPSKRRTGPHSRWLVVLVCVDFDDYCLGADGRGVTAIERLDRAERDPQRVPGGEQVPSGLIQADPHRLGLPCRQRDAG